MPKRQPSGDWITPEELARFAGIAPEVNGITVLGPNLQSVEETYHVHAAGCADIKRNYGPRGKMGGDDFGWTFEAETRAEVLARYPEAAPEEFRFFPCCANLT